MFGEFLHLERFSCKNQVHDIRCSTSNGEKCRLGIYSLSTYAIYSVVMPNRDYNRHLLWFEGQYRISYSAQLNSDRKWRCQNVAKNVLCRSCLEEMYQILGAVRLQNKNGSRRGARAHLPNHSRQKGCATHLT